VQEALDRLLIRIVPRPGYGDSDTRHLIHEMQRRVGQEMQIRVEVVDDIPVGASGKYRWVISKLPLDFRTGAVANLFDGEAGG